MSLERRHAFRLLAEGGHLRCHHDTPRVRANSGVKAVLSWSLIEVAIEPRSASDADILNAALSRLVANDTRLSFTRDKESGQFLLGGMSEDQLDVAITRLRDGNGPPINIGAPQVAYREQLGRAVRIDYVHKRIIGPKGEFAKVVIDFAPVKAGAGFSFENMAGVAVPSEFLPGVEKGLELARQNGVRAGFPLIDFNATLVNGAYHDIDSSPRAFQSAAQGAVRELKENGDVQLAEPWMTLEVMAPEEFIGPIVSDLNSRRGLIQDQHASGGTATINALAPLANMFGYANTLNSISEGRATYAMQFREYRTIPLPDDDPPFAPAIGMRA
jgi:elongation factor G